MESLDNLPEDQAQAQQSKLYEAFDKIFPEVVGRAIAQLRAAGGEPKFVQNEYMQSIAFKEGQTAELRREFEQDPHALVFDATEDFYNDPDAFCQRHYGRRPRNAIVLSASLSPHITPKLP